MAPINLPNGNEVGEIVLPNGATASEVIAPDGSTVFGNAIPDSRITRLRFEQDLTDSWDGNDGTDNGGVTYSTNSFEGDYAASFDGTDDFVTLGRPSNLDFAASDSFSVSAVINPDSTSAGGIAMTREYPGGSGNVPFIIFRLDDGVDVELHDGSDRVSASASVSTGSYQRFTFTYDGGGNLTLYKGSSQVGSDSNSLSGNFIKDTNGWHVGGDGAGGTYDGLIDVPDWYSEELTSTQVSNLHNTGSIDG